MEFTTVASVGDIPEGKGASFVVGDWVVAVFCVDAAYYAIEDQCPHMGSPLADGDVENGVVTCAWHQWRFQLSDGKWCDNRRIGIPSFEVRTLDGQIQVASEPRPKQAETD